MKSLVHFPTSQAESFRFSSIKTSIIVYIFHLLIARKGLAEDAIKRAEA